MKKHALRFLAKCEKWIAENKLKSALLKIASWIVAVLPGLLALAGAGSGTLIILLSVAGLILLVALCGGDYSVAKRGKMLFPGTAWMLTFVSTFALLGVIFVGRSYKRSADSRIEILEKTNDALLAQIEFTPEEKGIMQEVSIAFQRGCHYRDVETNLLESARAFEEAYTNSFAVAIKHPGQCFGTGHLAGDLTGIYLKLNRSNDSVLTAKAKQALQRFVKEDGTVDLSSPCLVAAVELRDEIVKQSAH